MQDIYSTTECGGGGRFSVGGDRRLRPNHHHHHQNQQAPKCPRCESPNTKFCYYNNYNLSQPRHFCKSCRRYWTKGGVLRNVPVGGGCRKSKRSKTKSTVGSSPEPKSSPKSNYNSNSESSTATATISAAGEATTEIVPATFASNSLNFPESSFFLHHTTNPSFDQLTLMNNNSTENQIFPDIGNFNTVMTSSNDPPTTGFNMTDIPTYRRDPNPEQWPKMVWSTKSADDPNIEEMGSGFLNHTGRVDVSSLQQSRANTSELASSAWQIGGAGGGVEHGLFDLTGSFDQSYWGQTQWGESDHTLNCLP